MGGGAGPRRAILERRAAAGTIALDPFGDRAFADGKSGGGGRIGPTLFKGPMRRFGVARVRLARVWAIERSRESARK